jgi:hypothetical protein
LNHNGIYPYSNPKEVYIESFYSIFEREVVCRFKFLGYYNTKLTILAIPKAPLEQVLERLSRVETLAETYLAPYKHVDTTIFEDHLKNGKINYINNEKVQRCLTKKFNI